jgi:hypothetical protein
MSKTSKISVLHKNYFREIFNLHAEDGKITYQGLLNIFEMVDFKPNEVRIVNLNELEIRS